MSWLADVIYGLKLENGQPMTLNQDSVSFDPASGQQNRVTRSFYVQNVIFLPFSTRQEFARTIRGIKEGILRVGDAQFIVDACDLPPNYLPAEHHYLLDAKNKRYDIAIVESVEDEIYILTTKGV